MKSSLEVVRIVSVLSMILLAIFLAACGGGGGGGDGSVVGNGGKEIDGEAFSNEVPNKIENEGIDAAISYIQDTIHVGDYVVKSGYKYKILDIDLCVDGSWVIGDGKCITSPCTVLQFNWYQESSSVELSLTYSEKIPLPAVTGIFPLGEWYSWTYEALGPDFSSDTRTLEPRREWMGEDFGWYLSGPFDCTLYELDDGIYYHTIYGEALLFKYPASAGDQYSNVFGGTIEVISVSEDITVPAGNFVCVVYRDEHTYYLDDSDAYTLFWLSPGVGMVKWEERLNGDTINSLSLVSYFIGD